MTVMLRIIEMTEPSPNFILLSGGPNFRLEYTPQPPATTVTEFIPQGLRDGGEVHQVTRPNVQESCRILFTADLVTPVQAQIRQLEAMLLRGERYARTRQGHPVFIELQLHAADVIYRSQLLTARAVPSEDLLAPWTWDAYEAEYVITWTRRFYWEGPLTEVPLTNGSLTAYEFGDNSVTGGVAIRNKNDNNSASDDNFVDIRAPWISGVLPSPLLLTLQNDTNDTVPGATYWIGHYLNETGATTAASLTHILEAEHATSVVGTVASDSDCSNGQKQTFTWSTFVETKLAEWTLSSAMLAACSNKYFRVLARLIQLGYDTSDIKVRLRVQSGTTVLAETDQHLIRGGELQEWGSLQLPPLHLGSTNLYPLTLCLYATDVGGATIVLDYLQLTPLDSFRRLETLGGGVGYGASLIDNAIENYVYTDGWAQAGRRGNYVAHGDPVMVWPGIGQRLYILHDTVQFRAPANRRTIVRAWYRPRRLTI